MTGPAGLRSRRRTMAWLGAVACAVLVISVAIPVALTRRAASPVDPKQDLDYVGLYQQSMPGSLAGAAAFTAATGVKPNVFMYYSAWQTPFQAAFATTAAQRGAVPLVQMNPTNVSLAAIAAGQYDGYLDSYAEAVRVYGRQVILGFGHEMNGNWYSWGYTRANPVAFVDVWRHVVTLFRRQGVRNVTWLWTANIMVTGGIPSPAQRWLEARSGDMVVLDGYYYSSSYTFASLFLPTIAAGAGRLHPRPDTHRRQRSPKAPISRPTSLDLAAGEPVRPPGFRGGSTKIYRDLRIESPPAIAAFRQVRGPQATPRRTPQLAVNGTGNLYGQQRRWCRRSPARSQDSGQGLVWLPFEMSARDKGLETPSWPLEAIGDRRRYRVAR